MPVASVLILSSLNFLIAFKPFEEAGIFTIMFLDNDINFLVSEIMPSTSSDITCKKSSLFFVTASTSFKMSALSFTIIVGLLVTPLMLYASTYSAIFS